MACPEPLLPIAAHSSHQSPRYDLSYICDCAASQIAHEMDLVSVVLTIPNSVISDDFGRYTALLIPSTAPACTPPSINVCTLSSQRRKFWTRARCCMMKSRHKAVDRNAVLRRRYRYAVAFAVACCPYNCYSVTTTRRSTHSHLAGAEGA